MPSRSTSEDDGNRRKKGGPCAGTLNSPPLAPHSPACFAIVPLPASRTGPGMGPGGYWGRSAGRVARASPRPNLTSPPFQHHPALRTDRALCGLTGLDIHRRTCQRQILQQSSPHLPLPFVQGLLDLPQRGFRTPVGAQNSVPHPALPNVHFTRSRLDNQHKVW